MVLSCGVKGAGGARTVENVLTSYDFHGLWLRGGERGWLLGGGSGDGGPSAGCGVGVGGGSRLMKMHRNSKKIYSFGLWSGGHRCLRTI